MVFVLRSQYRDLTFLFCFAMYFNFQNVLSNNVMYSGFKTSMSDKVRTLPRGRRSALLVVDLQQDFTKSGAVPVPGSDLSIAIINKVKQLVRTIMYSSLHRTYKLA